MSDAFENPATRLLDILKRVKGLNAESTLSVWATVFGELPTDVTQVNLVFNGLNELRKELGVCNQSLIDNGRLAPPHKKTISLVAEILSPPNLHEVFGQTAGKKVPDAIIGLEFIAHELPKEKVLTDEDLGQLRIELDKLFDEIAEADIDRNLRAFLLNLLAKMNQAIVQYRIHGARGMRNRLKDVFGELVAEYDYVKKAEQEVPTTWSTLIDVLNKTNQLSSQILGLTTIGVAAMKLLGG